jgi:phospholipase/lecithinase/hemolysin
VHDFNAGRHLNFVRLDVFALFNRIVASPSKYAFADVVTGSRGIPAIDPDTYLFWDDLHPTTRGHNILAITAARALDLRQCWTRSEAARETVSSGVSQ